MLSEATIHRGEKLQKIPGNLSVEEVVIGAVTALRFTVRRCNFLRKRFFHGFFYIEYHEIIWTSHSYMFLKIGVLKNFAILTGKHLC